MPGNDQNPDSKKNMQQDLIGEDFDPNIGGRFQHKDSSQHLGPGAVRSFDKRRQKFLDLHGEGGQKGSVDPSKKTTSGPTD